MSPNSWKLRLALSLVASLTAAAHAHAQNYAGKTRAPATTSIRVLENNAAAPSPYYTVVGAVRAPGVFQSEARKLPLETLMTAAGGLQPNALPTVRILRNGSSKLQILYTPGQSRPDDQVLAGDLLVVSARPTLDGAPPAADDFTAIACLGLIDRPLVLPLSPAIRTVNDLLPRLPQHPNLKTYIKVIDPTGRAATQDLVPGSVLVFESKYVDRSVLALQSFPPVVDLDHPPVNLDQPVPAAASLPPMEPAAVTITTAAGAMPAQPEPVRAASVDLDLEMTPAPLLAPVLPEPSIAAAPAPTIELERPQPVAPVEMASQVSAVHDPAPYEPAGHRPDVIRLDPRPRSISQTAHAPAQAEVTFPSPEISNRPPYVPEPYRVAQVDFPAVAPASRVDVDSLLAEAEAEEATAAEPSVKESPWPMVIGFLLTVSGLTVIGVIARLYLSSGTSSSSTAEPQLEREVHRPLPVPQPAVVNEPVSSGIQSLLSRKLPVIEEPPLLPPQLSMHGTPIGHRRLRLDTTHDSIPAPHFAAPQRVARQTSPQLKHPTGDERALRQALREACRSGLGSEAAVPAPQPVASQPVASQPDASVSDAPVPVVPQNVAPIAERLLRQQTAGIPVAPNPKFSAAAAAPPLEVAVEADIYDIVQPDPQQPQGSTRSPLERALQSLATEKRG
ncbi:hypothetical protein [Planctomicrobium sp. SH664]|uniref:hypothetical protein n=1 Tax=Planctomicrobium sp. SH664 TaxID=3448125 RepID=UPI003F5B97F5